MMWGLANLWKEGREGGYAVRHGAHPVRDLRPRRFTPPQNPTTQTPADHGEASTAQPPPDDTTDFSLNYFERAYPCLFPFGRGGIEAVRPKRIDFNTHVRWALRYHDRRFRKHETFPFVAFGIKQKREALDHASIQMRRGDFERDARVMASLNMEKLEQARIEEEKGLPPSDPAVRLLRKHVHATAGRVVGTDNARIRMRSEIRSTSIAHGPPSIWTTYNPSDAHDPLAQALVGEQINLDDFIATMGPDKERRSRNIAADPYGAAKFFHFSVNAILETLVQVKCSNYQVKSTPGIFGKVSAYFGTVEAQGRGTLHLHLLIWLKNTPSTDELADLLKSEEFREKMKAFIHANMRAHCPGLESAESVKAIPSDQGVAYSRPPHPDSPNYAEEVTVFEQRLARTLQVHTCKLRRCLNPNRHGQLVCKRKAPWPINLEDFVHENGEWGPKRTYPYVNGYNPPMLICGRCNNDCKLLTNGRETMNISYYVTGYAAKKQGRNFNISAILAQGYAYHVQHASSHTQELRDKQRLLIFRLVHAINREQELSAPMVISYLMGWGDAYKSHRYMPVFWSSFVASLLKAFPDIQTPIT